MSREVLPFVVNLISIRKGSLWQGKNGEIATSMIRPPETHAKGYKVARGRARGLGPHPPPRSHRKVQTPAISRYHL